MIPFFLCFGFLPVIGFVLIDSVASKRVALWSALLMGAIEAGYTIVATGSIDYITVSVFFLLAGFVVASLRTQDDFYFKISDAVTSILIALVLLFCWYVLHRALFLDMVNKYVGVDKLVAMNPKLDAATVSETFRVLSFQMPWWLLLYALLTIYAAANWSKWAWAFVRVPGFFIMLAFASVFAQATVLKE